MFDNGFHKAQQEYERKMTSPFDYFKSDEEYEQEYEEKCDAEITRAEALMEEQFLQERGLI